MDTTVFYIITILLDFAAIYSIAPTFGFYLVVLTLSTTDETLAFCRSDCSAPMNSELDLISIQDVHTHTLRACTQQDRPRDMHHG